MSTVRDFRWFIILRLRGELCRTDRFNERLKIRRSEGMLWAASSTGFSKAKQARILTREEGSRASAERSPLAPAFLNN